MTCISASLSYTSLYHDVHNHESAFSSPVLIPSHPGSVVAHQCRESELPGVNLSVAGGLGSSTLYGPKKEMVTYCV